MQNISKLFKRVYAIFPQFPEKKNSCQDAFVFLLS